tara:strand:+ start:174 stop:701 length:528 start_codon:yes stop_codon:yes gene_type:complete
VNITKKEVVEAFSLLYEAIHNKSFRKSLYLNEWTEQELLPLVRTFLLGYFGESLVPEAAVALPGALSGKGRLDFLIGNVAVEFAVRNETRSRANLSATVNSTEVKKLMKHPGLAVLILFDFRNEPLSENDIENFREWPSLGKGNHNKSPFNVAYFHRKTRSTKTTLIEKNIRVGA